MAASTTAVPTKTIEAKITSKGQITVPAEIRRILGVKAGDKLTFRLTAEGIKVDRETEENPHEGFRGTGNWLPAGYEGRDGVVQYFRELRGRGASDDLD